MPPSIFSEMSKLSQQHGAINLAQGFPDFDCDERLHRLVYSYTKKGYNQYAPLAGVPILRNKIAEIVHQEYRHLPNPETEITITAGATEGLYATIQAKVGLGEEVIIAKAGTPPKERQPGSMKGKIRIGDDFNHPLPPDIAEAFGA